jgi:hypothetical protein
MNAHDAGGGRRNEFLDPVRVHHVGGGIDVAENGADTKPLQRVRRGHEGQRRQDDVTRQSQGPDEHLKPHGGVGDGNAMPDAGMIADPPFEFLNILTIVGEPAAVEHIFNTRQQRPAVA